MKQYQKETEDDKGKVTQKYIDVLEVIFEKVKPLELYKQLFLFQASLLTKMTS